MSDETMRAQELTLISWEDNYVLSSKVTSVEDLLGIDLLWKTLCYNVNEPLDVLLYDLEYDTQAEEDDEHALREDMALIAANLATLLNDNAITVLSQRMVTFPVLKDLPTEIDKRKQAVMRGYIDISIE